MLSRRHRREQVALEAINQIRSMDIHRDVMTFLLSIKCSLVGNFNLFPNIPKDCLFYHIVLNCMQFLASQFKILLLEVELFIILNMSEIDILVTLLSKSAEILLSLHLWILNQLLGVISIPSRSMDLPQDRVLILHDILSDVELVNWRDWLVVLLLLLPDGLSDHHFKIDVLQAFVWTVSSALSMCSWHLLIRHQPSQNQRSVEPKLCSASITCIQLLARIGMNLVQI